MIWHQDHSNRTIILGFIQKRIFGHSQWRPYFKMAAIDIFLIGQSFFQKKRPQGIIHANFDACIQIWKIPQKKPHL